MASSLERIEQSWRITFSDTFHDYWRAYVPTKTPVFEVRRGETPRAWGSLGPHPARQGWWLITIGEQLEDPELIEITFAHEVMHLVLDQEGFPRIARGKQGLPSGQVIAAHLHSLLIHPILWSRLQVWEFPVGRHLQLHASQRLQEVQGLMHRSPSPSRFPAWQEWLIQYVLARLEWPEHYREEILELFWKRGSPVGTQGEKYLRRLLSAGYDRPAELSPKTVAEVGGMLLQQLDLGSYFNLASTKQLWAD